MDPELLDRSDSDYGNAWDFTNLQPAEEEWPELPAPEDDFGYTGEPIFATISPRYVINTSIPLLDQE